VVSERRLLFFFFWLVVLQDTCLGAHVNLKKKSRLDDVGVDMMGEKQNVVWQFWVWPTSTRMAKQIKSWNPNNIRPSLHSRRFEEHNVSIYWQRGLCITLGLDNGDFLEEYDCKTRLLLVHTESVSE
jgi:hypothetical protein